MPDDLIALTGATGAVGGRVAARLAEAGAPLRLVVRDPSRVQGHADAEVRPASGYGDLEGMQTALEGAGTLFLVPAAEAPDRVDLHRTAIDAAVAAGVGRIVYLSFLSASRDSTFTLARDHWGDYGRTYRLTGGESFTLGEAAELMAEASGVPIRFEDETDEEAFASRQAFGAPDWEIRGWVSSYQAIRDGSLEEVSPDVRRLTGRDPGSLREHLRAHPESLEHVVGPGR